MSFILSRLCTYFTLGIYLLVGTVIIRTTNSEMIEAEIPTEYFTFFSNTKLENNSQPLNVIIPEITKVEVKSEEKKTLLTFAKIKETPNKKNQQKKDYTVSRAFLPFDEQIKLLPIKMKATLPHNLVSLYKDLAPEKQVERKDVLDSVSSKLASSDEVEFFDYSDTKVDGPTVDDQNKIQERIVDKVKTVNEVNVDKIEESVEIVKTNPNDIEQVDVNDLISFDYSKAKQDLVDQSVVKISSVSNQNNDKSVIKESAKVTHSTIVSSHKFTGEKLDSNVTTQKKLTDVNKVKNFTEKIRNNKNFVNRSIVKISVTNLETTKEEVGFELRPQDDLSESISDYNSGEIVIDQKISSKSMTRSVAILKNGYSPTNTDLIVEEGVSEISIPLIESEKVFELLAPFEAMGPVGAVLLELDESVESASLDTPYSKVLKLDENMRITQADDFSYQFFIGVKAGNALLSYRNRNGETNSKIIHIHENEVTFDMNLYEEINNEKVSLVEEDLLSKDKTPLIISEDSVKQFATGKTLRKLKNNEFETNFEKTLLGSRKYLELNHQQEPVFIGYKDAKNLEVPSESFMRYILSQFENNKLANRCLIQINLNKKALRIETASESVANSLDLNTLILDSDGKFYDSVHEKSRKIIILGENNNIENNQDSKVNVKIFYQDNSVQYLSSYCSPNTYLIEQL